jgi:hypothetical protein
MSTNPQHLSIGRRYMATTTLGERARIVAAVFMLGFMLASASHLFAQADRAKADQPLFLQETALKGWTVKRWDDVSEPAEAHWELKDGVLHGGEPRGSWLLSEKEYGDFILEFEFKLGPLGNSGLALRAPLDGDPAFDGIELQMAEVEYNPEAKPSELTGGLYRAVAPTKDAYRTGKWNRYRVLLKGPTLKVHLNDELVQDIDLDQQDQVVQRHDGTDAPPIKDRPKRGHIGFQELSRGAEHVLIRNAMIRELP